MSTPAMQAWTVRRHGEPGDVLVWDTLDIPVPGPDEVRIAVRAAGVNFADALLCRGAYQTRTAPPLTPGLEVVGVVDGLGHGVDPDWRGRRVVSATRLPYGGYAPWCLARQQDLLAIPDGVADATAVALYVTYQTAWVALHRRGRLQPAETLLVHAAAGATGSAAVQVGRAAGAKVLATVGDEAKSSRARALGAHEVLVIRPDTDLRTWVLDCTDGRGADVVFDPVGGELFDTTRRCLAFEGRLLVIGFAGGIPPPLPANHLLVKNVDAIGVQWPAYRDHDLGAVRDAHAALLALLDAGAIDPLVSAIHPLTDARDVLDALVGRRTEGKLVLVPSGDTP